MQMNVNVYHPSKRRYDVDFPTWQADMGREFTKFMSLTDGAKSAADWVAYCNIPEGKHPMADLRVKHGYKEPFGAKFWELDNEVHRWFESEDYAWATVVYSKAMKAVDPTIQIGMVSYGDRPGKPTYHENIDKMLEIAGPYIDFLADRADADKTSAYMLGKVRAYNEAHGTHIKYCDSEWLAYNTDTNRDAYNMAKREGEVTKSYAFSKWLYALNLLKNFMSFQRLGDDVMFVNFNNLANTHSQSAMETPKEGAYLTASGRALELLSNSPAAWVLTIDNYLAKANDDYQVQASWDLTRNKLVLNICNRTASVKTADFDLSGLNKSFVNAAITRLQADSPVAMNTLQNQQAIKKTVSETKIKLKSGNYSVSIPAYSFTEVVLK
jgi:alpha-N-arabinofuranosidase